MGTRCSGTSRTRDSPPSQSLSPSLSPSLSQSLSPSPPSKNRSGGTFSSSSVSSAAAVRSANKLPFVRVRLSLLDASRQARDDPGGIQLRRCLRNERCWQDACSAKAFLARAIPTLSSLPLSLPLPLSLLPNGGHEPTKGDIQRQVSRFLKVHDQYLARASMLFKSRAFHEVYNERMLRALGPGESFIGDGSDDNNHNHNNNNNDDDDSVREGTGGTIRRRRRPRPIVELPRTAHRKPYVPLPAHWRTLLMHVDARGDGNDYDYDNDNDNDNETNNAVAVAGDDNRTTRIREEDVFSFSISHQFPFVGMANVSIGEAEAEETTTSTATTTVTETSPTKRENEIYPGRNGTGGTESIHDSAETTTATTTTAASTSIPERVLRDRLPPLAVVGLDIVVFDKLNTRLYSSHDEFLDVFRDQFTANEWEHRIQASAASAAPTSASAAAEPPTASSSIVPPSVTEFYLRWAMKEAYTKAMGFGMGLPFGSFEIHLEGIDDGQQGSASDNNNNNDNNNNEPLSLWEFVVQNTGAAAAFSRGESSSVLGSVSACASASMSASAFASMSASMSASTTASASAGLGATVRFAEAHQRSDEHACFYFLPLRSSSPSETIAEGCACVCVGSVSGAYGLDDNDNDNDNDDDDNDNDNDNDLETQLDVSWTDFETLTRFHHGDSE